MIEDYAKIPEWDWGLTPDDCEILVAQVPVLVWLKQANTEN